MIKKRAKLLYWTNRRRRDLFKKIDEALKYMSSEHCIFDPIPKHYEIYLEIYCRFRRIGF